MNCFIIFRAWHKRFAQILCSSSQTYKEASAALVWMIRLLTVNNEIFHQPTINCCNLAIHHKRTLRPKKKSVALWDKDTLWITFKWFYNIEMIAHFVVLKCGCKPQALSWLYCVKVGFFPSGACDSTSLEPAAVTTSASSPQKCSSASCCWTFCTRNCRFVYRESAKTAPWILKKIKMQEADSAGR